MSPRGSTCPPILSVIVGPVTPETCQGAQGAHHWSAWNEQSGSHRARWLNNALKFALRSDVPSQGSRRAEATQWPANVQAYANVRSKRFVRCKSLSLALENPQNRLPGASTGPLKPGEPGVSEAARMAETGRSTVGERNGYPSPPSLPRRNPLLAGTSALRACDH